MSKYIMIQNDGEIEINSFRLIGASTKRSDNTKIGFFGSGLKYSIAYMIRNAIKFRIFSGEKELFITTIKDTLRDQEFDLICINGQITSFTTTMGPTWTEDWFVLREIYCNALDESNCIIVPNTDIVRMSAGKTRIYIEITDNLYPVLNNWNAYFADERTPIFCAENVYSGYIAESEIRVSSDGKASTGVMRQNVCVYHKTEGIIFRKKIRVSVRDAQLYDYGLEYVDINEDRTAKNTTYLSYTICSLMARFENDAYVKGVLHNCSTEKDPCIEAVSLQAFYTMEPMNIKWIEFSYNNLLVIKEISGRYQQQMDISKKPVYLIPSSFAKRLKEKLPDIEILGLNTVVGGVGMQLVPASDKVKFLLNEVTKNLAEMKYEIPYEIIICNFENQHKLSYHDNDKRIIYLAESLFDEGKRKIAMTLMMNCELLIIMGETESLKYEHHLISEWLKMMENNAALFL